MTSSPTPLMKRFARTATLAGVCALVGPAAQAQSGPPIVLLLDQDAIAPNQPPNAFSAVAVNATIAAVGVRDFLPAFTGREGEHVMLPAGQEGFEGWFALTSTPDSWVTTPEAHDALENFVLAGPGLGSPDENGDRQTWLGAVPGVQPLHTSGLQMLVGQMVCAVVYANEIPWTQTTTSLAGATLGMVAIAVVGVTSGDAPSVEVQMLDPKVCSGPLALFINPPPSE